MKLDPTYFRYITKDEFRVLTAVEMGMRNHELVPTTLIESIAKITRGGVFKMLSTLLRHKLVAHDGKKYDGYRLTYHGYDFLALRAMVARGTIVAVGRRIGVGKESDVHCAQGPKGEVYALKLHRLGRISFRNIKEKRDYLQHRTHGSWMYMARLAAVKEFAYMKALKDEGFPVPEPLDQNRHCVLMSLIDATPMYRLVSFNNPDAVLERLMRLLVRLARAGIVHGDYNEFNLMISDDEKVTLIDFPQIINLTHANAQETFERDCKSICDFFRKRLHIEVETFPTWEEVLVEAGAAGAGALANLTVEGITGDDDALLVGAHGRSAGDGERRQRESKDDDDEDDTSDEDGDSDSEAAEDAALEERPAAASPEAFAGLVPEGGAEALDTGTDMNNEALAAAEAAVAAAEGAGDAQEGEKEEGENASESEAEDSDGPGQVTITKAKRTRKRLTAKEARTNLQKQQKQKPAKPNNQKVASQRRAKHEIKEYFA